MCEALGLQSWPLNLAHLLGLPYTCYYYPWPRVLPRVMEHYVLGVIPRPCIHDTRHDAGTESIVTSIAATVFGFASLLFSPSGTCMKLEGRRVYLARGPSLSQLDLGVQRLIPLMMLL